MITAFALEITLEDQFNPLMPSRTSKRTKEKQRGNKEQKQKKQVLRG